MKLKKIVEIHDNATKYVQENPDDSVSQLPKDIVANPDIEKKIFKRNQFCFRIG